MIYSLFFTLYSLFFILYSLFFILYSLFFIIIVEEGLDRVGRICLRFGNERNWSHVLSSIDSSSFFERFFFFLFFLFSFLFFFFFSFSLF